MGGGTLGAVSVARWRGHCGGPRLWLSPQCGDGGPPTGGRGGADPPRDLPPGNRGRPALQCAALAPATGVAPSGSGTAGVAGETSVSRAAGRHQARSYATRRARRRARRKAQKAGRTITAPTLAVAGWLLLITTLDAGTWSTADVLYVYRARWQVELVFKKMKQLLRLNQIRSKHPTSVEATVRALLIAWHCTKARRRGCGPC